MLRAQRSPAVAGSFIGTEQPKLATQQILSVVYWSTDMLVAPIAFPLPSSGSLPR